MKNDKYRKIDNIDRQLGKYRKIDKYIDRQIIQNVDIKKAAIICKK